MVKLSLLDESCFQLFGNVLVPGRWRKVPRTVSVALKLAESTVTFSGTVKESIILTPTNEFPIAFSSVIVISVSLGSSEFTVLR